MQHIVIETSSVRYHGQPHSYYLQVKTFNFSYNCSYFWVEMVEKNPILAQPLSTT